MPCRDRDWQVQHPIVPSRLCGLVLEQVAGVLQVMCWWLTDPHSEHHPPGCPWGQKMPDVEGHPSVQQASLPSRLPCVFLGCLRSVQQDLRWWNRQQEAKCDPQGCKWGQIMPQSDPDPHWRMRHEAVSCSLQGWIVGVVRLLLQGVWVWHADPYTQDCSGC